MADQLKMQGPIAGRPVIQLGAYDPGKLGYVVEEYFFSGTAPSYNLIGQRGNAMTFASRY
jgi:hypothetical protein